ncbi:hypothetical protein BTZ13_08730 [Staphylococcus condimenti]|uniref:beta-class phenol-soluble modulin n=1 Tax=Staphylococcus condimenti TaxID=70255 RepID=UPI0009474F15|nr:beta-class phenol-soluble modulin [Staphylococcus condimenti]APR61290.1 hypothetical protein BTZ13_08730 [Staphylococcus condimenti]
MLTKLAQAIVDTVNAAQAQDPAKLGTSIVDTVNAAQAQDPAKLGTSIVDIVQNGVGIVGKLFGF